MKLGDYVYIAGGRDMAMEKSGLGKHIGETARLIKVTKAGLYQVMLRDGTLVSYPKWALRLSIQGSFPREEILPQLRKRLARMQPSGWYDSWSGVFQVEGERRRMEHPDRAVPLYSIEQIEDAFRGE